MKEPLRIVSSKPAGALEAADPVGGQAVVLLHPEAISAAGGIPPLKVAQLRKLQQLDLALLAFGAEGMNDKEIARRVGLPSTKVHQRWRNVRDILGAKDRAHAVAIAFALRLIGPPTRALELLTEYLSQKA